ncbi:tetratricopeptide repeat protein [Flammeovirga sp. SubArs3]|uniref:tetratricopeptide repeat protein n=1 Tax=Flammeovirga sp. SubArs3 TaxID=2995316 RepID=UPI00248AF40B|nr:tetratricopeptide repeat protein [Flammeovirga sp. SubArs3]
MNQQRLEQLFDFYKEDPNDPFIIYGIATEYTSDEDWDKALEYYKILLKDHEDYAGTYYHAARAFAENGQSEEAEAVYVKGLEICKKVNDQHALKELQTAYTNFQLEDDDEW